MTVKYIYLLSALFGLLLPMAVRAQNVSNTGAYPHYASPYVFHKNTATDIGYAYNSNGSMTRNPDRHIGLIEYDSFNNPRLIQFTDGSATEYVYDASGTKLKTVHRTAVPGIEVPYGTVYAHTSSTLLSSDSTLYAGPFVLSGDSLRCKYDGGSVLIPLDGSPVKPCFYALDHLGSVRLVVSADGQVIERNDYYPSGCLITENIDGETVILPYKYNGKELDPMHGLYTYDYGARQYDPATMLWDRMDPLCEDNPEVSPYVYCLSNPVNAIDPDGKRVWVFATKLPSEKGGDIIRFATHTFVVVQTSKGKIHRFEYGPQGDPFFGISTLRQLYYDKSGNAVNNYMKGIQDDCIKNVIEVNVPTGMTMDEFNKNVINSAAEFSDNTEIKYRIVPIGETEGNCNTSTTSLLKNAGVSNKEINRIRSVIKGVKTGLGTYKPWTYKERQQAIKKKEERLRLSESLSNHIGF